MTPAEAEAHTADEVAAHSVIGLAESAEGEKQAADLAEAVRVELPKYMEVESSVLSKLRECLASQ